MTLSELTVNNLLTSILYCDSGQFLIMDIIFTPVQFLSETPCLYFEKAIRLSREIIIFLAAI